MTKAELIKAISEAPDEVQINVHIISEFRTKVRKVSQAYYCEANDKIVLEIFKSQRDDNAIKS